jgi:ligand-binding SRPBCC domain-containing protein
MPTFARSVIIDAPTETVSAFYERPDTLSRRMGGLLRSWVHSHETEDLGDTTRLTDRVEYELPGGPFVNTYFAWLANLGLGLVFRHRHRVTKRFCESQ